MKRIYLQVPDHFANGYLRAVLPAQHCKEQLLQEGIEVVASEAINMNEPFDAYLFHRTFTPRFLPEIEKLKLAGKRVWWGTDDDLWNVPNWNPAYPHFLEPEKKLLDLAVQISDGIQVTTPELAEVVNKPNKTFVCPNLLDVEDYPARGLPPDDKVRILWAGSIHHDKDLDQLIPAVEQLHSEYGEKISFTFFGYLPTGLGEFIRITGSDLAQIHPCRKFDQSLTYLQPVNLARYPTALVGLCPDIGLCPVIDCKFNLSKSNIKWCEYSMAGAASICTDLAPYKCAAGTALLVAPDNPAGWYTAIKRLIDDAGMRQDLAAKARERVVAEWSWKCLEKKEVWLNVLRRMVA